ncbi:hypothetical protein [Nitrosomonas marina]|nr:hypothetical protein [Nitrosomonas marina]
MFLMNAGQLLWHQGGRFDGVYYKVCRIGGLADWRIGATLG